MHDENVTDNPTTENSDIRTNTYGSLSAQTIEGPGI